MFHSVISLVSFFLHARSFVLIYLCQYKWNALLYGTDNKSGLDPHYTHTYTFPLLYFTNFFFFEVSSALAADCHFLPKILILLIFFILKIRREKFTLFIQMTSEYSEIEIIFLKESRIRWVERKKEKCPNILWTISRIVSDSWSF